MLVQFIFRCFSGCGCHSSCFCFCFPGIFADTITETIDQVRTGRFELTIIVFDGGYRATQRSCKSCSEFTIFASHTGDKFNHALSTSRGKLRLFIFNHRKTSADNVCKRQPRTTVLRSDTGNKLHHRLGSG